MTILEMNLTVLYVELLNLYQDYSLGTKINFVSKIVLSDYLKFDQHIHYENIIDDGLTILIECHKYW
jgi:hypothetical protein